MYIHTYYVFIKYVFVYISKYKSNLPICKMKNKKHFMYRHREDIVEVGDFYLLNGNKQAVYVPILIL